MNTKQSTLRRMLPKLVVSILVGAAIAAIVVRNGVPLVPRRESFARLELWTVPAYIGLLLVLHWFRAARFRYLAAPMKEIPLRDVITLNWIGFFAIFALPLRLGEVVRPALSKMRHGIPFSAGVGTIAVERVVDGLVASFAVAYALFVLPMRETEDPIARHLPAYGMTALAVFGSAFLALFLFLSQRALAGKLISVVVGFVSPRLASLISQKIEGIADGIRSIAVPRLALPFLAETLVYWGLNAVSMWLLARGCGLPISVGHAVAIMGILAIGILLPAGPGMFGPFQLAIAAGLSCYLPATMVEDQGALFIFMLYVLQMIVIGLAGIIPLYTDHVNLREVLETEPSQAG